MATSAATSRQKAIETGERSAGLCVPDELRHLLQGRLDLHLYFSTCISVFPRLLGPRLTS